MHFLYEAVDNTGKPLMGKIDANTAEEVQQLLTKSGLSVQSVAPVMAKMQPVASSSNPTPQKAVAPVLHQSDSSPVWMPSMEPRAAPVDLSAIGHLDSQVSLMGSAHRELTTVASTNLHTQVSTLPPLQSSPPIQRATPTNASLSGQVIFSGNAASLSQSVGMGAKLSTKTATATRVATPASLSYVGATDRDRLMFFQQLASLVRSGMSIYSALDNLAPRTPAKSLSLAAMKMATAARTGGQISAIMAEYPVLFPEHITATVAAGETGGFLEISLAEIALNYQRKIDLYRGTWIPKLMATQAFFMIPIVLPLMGSIFASMDFAANMAHYVKMEIFFYLPVSFALFFGSKFIFKRLQLPKFQEWRDGLALKVPPFNELHRQESLGSFIRMLRRLFEAGVAPIAAWEGAMNVSSNVVIREKLRGSYGMMQSGASFSEAFTATGLFNNEIENLVITGQQSGQVVEMLDQAADYYEMQAGESAKRAKFTMLRMGILAMLVFGGAAVLWMAHSYFHGIFTFVDREFGTPD